MITQSPADAALIAACIVRFGTDELSPEYPFEPCRASTNHVVDAKTIIGIAARITNNLFITINLFFPFLLGG